jgi:hypothetical protein
VHNRMLRSIDRREGHWLLDSVAAQARERGRRRFLYGGPQVPCALERRRDL